VPWKKKTVLPNKKEKKKIRGNLSCPVSHHKDPSSLLERASLGFFSGSSFWEREENGEGGELLQKKTRKRKNLRNPSEKSNAR